MRYQSRSARVEHGRVSRRGTRQGPLRSALVVGIGMGLGFAGFPEARAEPPARCVAAVAGPADAPFVLPEISDGMLILEIHVPQGADPAAVGALTSVLERHKLRATVLVSPEFIGPGAPLLRELVKKKHEVGVLLAASTLPNPGVNPTLPPGMKPPPGMQPRGPGQLILNDWLPELQEPVRALRLVTGKATDAVAIDALSGGAEQAFEAMGVRAVLPLDPDEPGPARVLRSVDGQPARGRVLPANAWSDGCGPSLPAWTPVALDRASALAATKPGLRLALPLQGADPALLDRWLREVVEVKGWKVLTASEAAARVRSLGATLGRVDTAPAVEAPGRFVSKEALLGAAAVLAEAQRLPRRLPGDLSLTEAALGLMAVLADPTAEGHRLPAARGPSELARGSVPAGAGPSAEELRVAVAELLPGMRGTLPGVVSVGVYQITINELVVILAQAALGRPLVIAEHAPPDPYAPDLGWGLSGAP